MTRAGLERRAKASAAWRLPAGRSGPWPWTSARRDAARLRARRAPVPPRRPPQVLVLLLPYFKRTPAELKLGTRRRPWAPAPPPAPPLFFRILPYPCSSSARTPWAACSAASARPSNSPTTTRRCSRKRLYPRRRPWWRSWPSDSCKWKAKAEAAKVAVKTRPSRRRGEEGRGAGAGVGVQGPDVLPEFRRRRRVCSAEPSP